MDAVFLGTELLMEQERNWMLQLANQGICSEAATDKRYNKDGKIWMDWLLSSILLSQK